MTTDEFSNLYLKYEQELPSDALTSLRYYLTENWISFQIIINDASIDKLELKHGVPLPIAITLFEGRNCYVAFREKVLRAPDSIKKTIIQHELIHVFLGPVLNPIPNQKNFPKQGREMIRRFRDAFEATTTLRHKKAASFGLYEEGLVSFINKSWGNDEDAANLWINFSDDGER